MKKILFSLIFMLLIAGCALAEADFTLDERALIPGMERTWLQGHTPPISDGTLSICLPIRSESAYGNITATLIIDDEASSPFKTQKMSASFSRNESRLYPVKLRLKLLSDYQKGDYYVTVRIEGKDKEGNVLSTDFPLVLRLWEGKPRTESLTPVISGMNPDLNVGENGSLSFELENPCLYADMTDLVLTVEDSSGDVLPLESDTMELNDLLSGSKLQVSVPLTVQPNAKVTMHRLKLTLTYSVFGEAKTLTETFTVPVKQEIRLEHGGTDMASTVIQGDSVALTLPLMNLGHGEIRNAMVTLNLPGIVENQSVLVGTIAAGETKQAKLNFAPGKEVLGELTGTAYIYGEDAWGNQVDFQLPVSLIVEEKIEAEAAEKSETTTKMDMPPVLVYVLSGVCALLLLLLMVQHVVMTRKIHRIEEANL